MHTSPDNEDRFLGAKFENLKNHEIVKNICLFVVKTLFEEKLRFFTNQYPLDINFDSGYLIKKED